MEYTGQWINLFTGKLTSNEYVELPVLSGSMHPLLSPGDRVKIACKPWKNCHIGDIIVFKEGKQLTVHRLLFLFSIGNKCILYQKGDMNRSGSFIASQQILGKVIEIIKPDNSHIDLGNNYKGKRTIAIKKLIVVILFLIPRYGKELIKWMINHL